MKPCKRDSTSSKSGILGFWGIWGCCCSRWYALTLYPNKYELSPSFPVSKNFLLILRSCAHSRSCVPLNISTRTIDFIRNAAAFVPRPFYSLSLLIFVPFLIDVLYIQRGQWFRGCSLLFTLEISSSISTSSEKRRTTFVLTIVFPGRMEVKWPQLCY